MATGDRMSGPASTRAALTLEESGHGVARVVFDDPARSVNVLTRDVMARLDALLDEVVAGAEAGRWRALVIHSGKDGHFVAGADVQAIASVASAAEGQAAAAEGQALFQRLATLPIPTVAAIDGLCLGGGTELALACRARIAADRPETRIGLPEVRLGILPGFGGTTRLPRLVGLQEALGMILTGKTVDARKAERIGLVDERLHPAVLVERAVEVAGAMADGAPAPARGKRPLASRLLEGNPLGRKLILSQARKRVMKETGGHYPAPLAILDEIGALSTLPVERALAREAVVLGRLIVTPESRNLLHVFFLMEAARKGGLEGAEPQPVKRLAVVGAGVMGGGIAQLAAARGMDVRMKDIRQEALTQGLQHAGTIFDKAVRRRRMKRREADAAMGRIAPTLDYAGFGTVELVVEAVVERMEVKRAVLREVEARVRPGTVLATNTSALSLAQMATALERPGDFCGMHFFNPVHRMPLVEVVRAEGSSSAAVATVFAAARQLDKTPVVVRDAPGFLVNRVLAPYMNEAGWLLADGAGIQEIDRALLDFGMPMGPLRLLDEVGLDVARHAADTLHAAFGERMAPAPPLVALRDTDLLGRKGGRGFYVYEAPGGKEEGANGEVLDRIAPDTADGPDAEAIRERCLLVMVNEAARALEEEVVAGPGDVDLAMIMGTGFPPFRGGLLRWADARGTARTLADLEALAARLGARFEPAPRLRRLGTGDTPFYGA